jgi:DNA modification methylase
MTCERMIGPYPCCSIVHGDCLELMKSLPDGCVDAVVTSPPYNQLGSRIPKNPTGMWARTDGGAQWVIDVNEKGYFDDRDEDDYQRWQNDLFADAARVASSTGSLFYNHQVRWRDRRILHPIDWFKPRGWDLRQEIIWRRAGGMMLNARMFVRVDERVLWFVRGEWKWNQEMVGLGTVWDITQETDKEHPVGYPEELPARAIAAATFPGDMVLDPFHGGGTTSCAAKRLGRHYLGFEINDHWCEIARDRLARIDAQPTLFEPKPEQLSLGGE